jgi:hypothetical protein
VRTIYGILIVSLLLFAGGVVFFVLGIRAAGQAPAAAPAASVKQIMRGIVAPASTAIYDAVSTTVTEQGTKDVFPRNDRDWERVGSSAMALVEAANLLKVEGRARDGGDWPRMSDAMVKAAMQSYRAAERKDTEALLAAGEVLNNSCDSCHRNYEVVVESR